MRMSPNDTPGSLGLPERKCILSGVRAAKPDLIMRLALGPDGQVAPDVHARAPGRGAWIGVDRATLEAALAKGKLKGALARAFKTGDITIPADLVDRIAAVLERATLDRLGLEARAGHVLCGSDRIAEAARAGRLHLLLHAADAGADGSRKLDQAWRVGTDTEGSGASGLTLVADRARLSPALGRENVVHIGITDAAAAARVRALVARWHAFLGRPEPDPTGAPPAQDEQAPIMTREGY